MAKPEQSPVFEPVFGESWSALPAVMHKHYANRAHSHDTVVMKGRMYFKASRMARLLAPLLRMGGMPPIFTANDIPVTVQIGSQPNSNHLAFHRVFECKKSKVFNTEYVTVGGNQLIDWTKGDTGWLMIVQAQGDTITMTHGGYRGRLFGKTFRLPLEGIIGETSASETAIDDNRFSMCMEIRRRNGALFYSYGGEFEIAGVMRRD